MERKRRKRKRKKKKLGFHQQILLCHRSVVVPPTMSANERSGARERGERGKKKEGKRKRERTCARVAATILSVARGPSDNRGNGGRGKEGGRSTSIISSPAFRDDILSTRADGLALPRLGERRGEGRERKKAQVFLLIPPPGGE